MKTEEIRKLTVEEIQTKLADVRDELMKLRFQQVTGQLTDTSKLRLLRRDVARMETIAKESLNAPVQETIEEPEKKPKAKPKAKAKVEAKEETKKETEAKPKAKAKTKPKAKPKAKAETEKGEA